MVHTHAVQDVFLQCFENLESIKSPEHLKAWLRRAASHRCIDVVRRPIIDKTGLKRLYDIVLEFPGIGPVPARPPNIDPAELENQMNQIDERVRELIPTKLEEQTGLKLEPTRAPVEVLVIEHAEKPSQN